MSSTSPQLRPSSFSSADGSPAMRSSDSDVAAGIEGERRLQDDGSIIYSFSSDGASPAAVAAATAAVATSSSVGPGSSFVGQTHQSSGSSAGKEGSVTADSLTDDFPVAVEQTDLVPSSTSPTPNGEGVGQSPPLEATSVGSGRPGISPLSRSMYSLSGGGMSTVADSGGGMVLSPAPLPPSSDVEVFEEDEGQVETFDACCGLGSSAKVAEVPPSSSSSGALVVAPEISSPRNSDIITTSGAEDAPPPLRAISDEKLPQQQEYSSSPPSSSEDCCPEHWELPLQIFVISFHMLVLFAVMVPAVSQSGSDVALPFYITLGAGGLIFIVSWYVALSMPHEDEGQKQSPVPAAATLYSVGRNRRTGSMMLRSSVSISVGGSRASSPLSGRGGGASRSVDSFGGLTPNQSGGLLPWSAAFPPASSSHSSSSPKQKKKRQRPTEAAAAAAADTGSSTASNAAAEDEEELQEIESEGSLSGHLSNPQSSSASSNNSSFGTVPRAVSVTSVGEENDDEDAKSESSSPGTAAGQHRGRGRAAASERPKEKNRLSSSSASSNGGKFRSYHFFPQSKSSGGSSGGGGSGGSGKGVKVTTGSSGSSSRDEAQQQIEARRTTSFGGTPSTMMLPSPLAAAGTQQQRQQQSQAQVRYCDHCEKFVCLTSRHCKRCGTCCLGFDHHCSYLNRCVGVRNHLYFAVVVSSTIFMTLVGFVLCFFFILEFFQDGGDTFERRMAGAWGLAAAAAQNNSTLLLNISSSNNATNTASSANTAEDQPSNWRGAALGAIILIFVDAALLLWLFALLLFLGGFHVFLAFAGWRTLDFVRWYRSGGADGGGSGAEQENGAQEQQQRQQQQQHWNATSTVGATAGAIGNRSKDHHRRGRHFDSRGGGSSSTPSSRPSSAASSIRLYDSPNSSIDSESPLALFGSPSSTTASSSSGGGGSESGAASSPAGAGAAGTAGADSTSSPAPSPRRPRRGSRSGRHSRSGSFRGMPGLRPSAAAVETTPRGDRVMEFLDGVDFVPAVPVEDPSSGETATGEEKDQNHPFGVPDDEGQKM